MAELRAKAALTPTITLTINESELRALDALAGYGTEEFIKFFYQYLGKTYLEPHVEGLRSLFQTVRHGEGQLILNRINDARDVFEQRLMAIKPPPLPK